ncbi:MAG: ABC transporter ATP-binding protein [Bacteroidaceae bacterium]|nr:ABC transporter ATP-binding protein [Bacteroidaceae bacterium]
MIELKNLSTGYGRHTVSANLNATLQSGRLTCLLGPNGVGKSTLLRTLCGFQPPLEGRMEMDGKDMAQLSRKEMSRSIGVVLTERPDVTDMRASDMVALGRTPYTGFWGRLGKEDRNRVDEAMQLVGITHLAHRMIHTLSDGERQKVMIAKALAQQTPVILLDEPTAFLDFPSKVETMRLLHRLAHESGKTVFLSTHDLETAIQLSDDLWLLSADGLESGTADSLSADGSLERFVSCKGIRFDAARKVFYLS